jgi:hypothetical protein
MCSGTDEITRMYAFHCMLPQALHNKLIGISPQPTTLTQLVTKTRKFDRLWHLYKRPSTTTRGSNKPQFKAQTTMTNEEGSSTQINYANLDALGGKISKEEIEQCYAEKLYYYCGVGKYLAKDCQKKRAQQNN